MFIAKFIKEKILSFRALGTFFTFVGALAALDYLYKTYWVGPTTEPIVWAFTIVLVFYGFIGILNYCFFAQLIMQGEIDRMAKVKARLEAQILKKRKSSNKRKNR